MWLEFSALSKSGRPPGFGWINSPSPAGAGPESRPGPIVVSSDPSARHGRGRVKLRRPNLARSAAAGFWSFTIGFFFFSGQHVQFTTSCRRSISNAGPGRVG